MALFLNDKIMFTDIARLVEGALERIPAKAEYDLDDVLAADIAARDAVKEMLR